MPDWVARPAIKALDAHRWARVKTLDEAFGVVWPKRKQLDRVRKQMTTDLGVLMRIEELGRQTNEITGRRVASDTDVSLVDEIV